MEKNLFTKKLKKDSINLKRLVEKKENERKNQYKSYPFGSGPDEIDEIGNELAKEWRRCGSAIRSPTSFVFPMLQEWLELCQDEILGFEDVVLCSAIRATEILATAGEVFLPFR